MDSDEMGAVLRDFFVEAGPTVGYETAAWDLDGFGVALVMMLAGAAVIGLAYAPCAGCGQCNCAASQPRPPKEPYPSDKNV